MADDQEYTMGDRAAGEAEADVSAASVYPPLENKDAEVAGSAPAEAAKPEPTPGEKTPEPPKAGPEPGELGNKGKEELISLRKQRQESQQEAAYWKGVAEGRIKPEGTPVQVPQEPQGVIRPKAEDYDTQEGYEDALLTWHGETIKRELSAATNQDATSRRLQEIETGYREKLRTAEADDPGITEIATRRDLPISPTMAQIIKESENPPRLIRYFHDNLEIAMKLYGMAQPVVNDRGQLVGINGNPLAVAREIGRIEARLLSEKTTPKTPTKAPEPHEPVGGQKGVIDAGDAFDPNLSTEDRIARWKGQGKK